MTAPIRVLLVDDQELIRVGFRLVLEAEADMEVVGEAADGASAVRAAVDLQPDVVLMDVRMPGTDGISATATIVRAQPTTRVLILTTFDLDEYAFGAIRAGASGFLLKDAQRDHLVSAIRSVHRGEGALAPRVTRALLDHVAARLPEAQEAPSPGAHSRDAGAREERDPSSAGALRELTEREREVFLAIGQGFSNGEIAQRLFLSESTVKTHVGRVLAKLGVRDRVHAVILAHQLGVAGTDAAR